MLDKSGYQLRESLTKFAFVFEFVIHFVSQAYIDSSIHTKYDRYIKKYEKVFRSFEEQRTKYPNQELTEDDKKVLDQIPYKYVAKYYNLTQKYPNPKEYAQKEIVKAIRSDQRIALLHVITYAKNYPPGHSFRPGEINQKLADQIQSSILQDYVSAQVQERYEKDSRFLHPRDLRQKVLKELERHGIFIHLGRIEEIRHYEQDPHRPGRRPSSNVARRDRGGKRSVYIVTDRVEKLKKAMKKPQALDYLYDKVIRSGLAHQLAKYSFAALFHASKMDERVLHRLVGIGASFYQTSMTEKDITNLKIEFQILQSLDDNQIDEQADLIARYAIEDRGFYALLFASGLELL